MRDTISFVIPCYRSEKTVAIVIDEIIEKVRERSGEYDYEIVAVNDCSPDNVIDVLASIAKENYRVKVIDFAGNVGKHAAILAGYNTAQGKYVVTVDDDGQCPIDNLWELIKPLEEGHDMSMASYGKKKESMFKRFGSAVNHAMSKSLMGKPDNVVFTNFIARQDYVCKAMCSYQNTFPYLEGLSLRITRDIVMVPMEERSGMRESSGFTLGKSLSLWLNGFTAFSVKPLRISSFIGAVLALISLVAGIFVFVRKLLVPSIPAGYSSIILVILFCSGILLLQLGLLGEYIGRIYIAANRYPQYVIKHSYNLDRAGNVGVRAKTRTAFCEESGHCLDNVQNDKDLIL